MSAEEQQPSEQRHDGCDGQWGGGTCVTNGIHLGCHSQASKSEEKSGEKEVIGVSARVLGALVRCQEFKSITIIYSYLRLHFDRDPGKIVVHLEFEELGFDSLLNSMVVVMPITAVALALAKGWFLNRSRNGAPHNDSEVNMGTSNITNKNGSNSDSNNLTLKTAIGTVLKVAYDTTIGLGVGKLLAAPPGQRAVSLAPR